jgi:hypothetical protein
MKASVTTKIQNHNNQNYVAQFSTSNTFETVISTNEEQPDNFSLINFSINGLLENTRYYVRIVDSLLNPIDSYVGSFKTPANSPSSFKFGFASCSWSDSTSASNQRIYDNIANKALSNELDFFFHLGDMHYRDISINDESLFQDAFDDVFAAPRQNNCWKNLSMFYMWDDHDYGQNDTDKNSPSRDAATEAFRRRVPSPPLANNLTNGAVYYSFVRGRVRFIVTDLRSEREPKGAFPSNDPLQKPFSDTQRDWFFAEMLAAKDSEQIIVWINTKPWISSIENEKDDWGGYHAARLAIVNFIETNGLRDSIVVLSGDMHALAYDDGSSSNNFGDLKVCHAAPLDQESRAKGGPYTIGPIAQDSGTGWSTQYGIIEVTDNGDDFINIRFKGIVISKTNFTESTAIDIDFNLNVIGGIPDAPNIPIASNITNNSFIVSWDAVNNADSYVLQYTNGSNIQTINAANNAGQAITELTAGTTYYVRVRAVNSAGESANSPNLVQITRPDEPSIPTLIAVADAAFVLQWNAVTGAESYTLEVSTIIGLGFNSGIIQTIYDANNTSQAITGLTAGTIYYVRVRAVNSAGQSANSSILTQRTITLAPNAPTLTNVSTSGFTASWNTVAGATSYILEYSTSENFSSLQTIPSANNAGEAVTELNSGTTYYVRVRAVNSAGNSAPSPFVPQITVPGVPTGLLTTSVSATGFTANWTAVMGAQSYRLDVSTFSNFATRLTGYDDLTVSGTSRSITGLTAGSTYYVQVRAVNSAGTSQSSEFAQQQTPTVITVPNAPNMSSSTSVTATGFTANWTAVTNAQSYRIDVSLFSNFATRLTDYDNLTVNGTSQPIIGLTAGTTYYVQVRAVNSAGTSADSDFATQITLPGVPNMSSSTSVTATGFTANWTAVSSATSYILQVSTATGLGFNSQIIQTISNVNSTSQAITGLNAGTTYYVRVRAVNIAGQGGNSNPVTQRTLPDAPTGLSITSVTATGFTANWNAVTSAQRYRLDVSLFSNFATRLTDYDNLTVNGTSQPITGLTAGTTYYVQVRAENGAQGFGQGAYSNPVTQITLPNAPTGLSITSVTTTGFTANWNAVSNATSYLIDVSAVSGFGSFIFGYQNKTVNALTLPITGLAPGTTYYVRVYTVTSTGTSDPSFPVEKITITPAPNLPTLTNVSTGGFTASWNAVAGANSYTLEYSTSETFSSLQTIPFANNTGEAVTELNSGTTYYVRVRAVNDGGISAPSPFAQQQTLTFTNPFYYDGLAIYLGNENAVTDDDININIQEPGPTTSPLTYVTAGRYVDNIGGCNGANNCALGSVTLNFPCDLVRELTLPVSERPYSVSILSLSDFKNTVDNFESIIKDPNVENYILESFADKDNVLVRTLSEDICPVSFCAACTGIVLLPQTAGDIENLEATQEWNSWFLNSRIKNDTIGSFDCSSSGAMNLDLQYSSQLLPNYLSGILSTGISIQYRSALPHGCGNWGAYKVYAIKYLNEAVYYKENNFLNFDKVLLATGIYAGGSNENELLANFTVPNVFRMVESQVTFRVDMTTAIQIGEDFFYNGTDEVCVAGSFNDFDYFQYKLDRVGESNIFETTITINGSNLQKFEYSFGVIYEGDFGLMTLPEFESVEYRNFIFREGTQILNTFCWKNNRTDCPTENLIVSASINSTNQTLSRYTINEIPNNPPITLVRGNTYEFIFQNLSSQTFWIKTSPIVGTTNAYPGTTPIPDAGIYNFTPNRDTPNTLYYISENNSAMQGIINIVNPS